jgi:hypothetical protein
MKYKVTTMRTDGKESKEFVDTPEAVVNMVSAHLLAALRCGFPLSIACERVRMGKALDVKVLPTAREDECQTK